MSRIIYILILLWIVSAGILVFMNHNNNKNGDLIAVTDTTGIEFIITMNILVAESLK